MKTTTFPIQRLLLAGAVSLFLAILAPVRAQGDDTNEASITAAKEMDDTAAKQGAATVTARLSADFAALAGTTANANALVTGLHDGSTVSLTTVASGTSQTKTFTPATGKLGYGNVFISLALAQSELTKAGIANPTPDQLVAALNGGNVTVGGKTVALNGVLTLRASGQGWGQIARTLNVRLGSVLSDLHVEHAALAHADRPESSGKADKPEHASLPDKVERASRPDKVDLPQKPERPDRPSKPDRPERPDRPSHG